MNGLHKVEYYFNLNDVGYRVNFIVFEDDTYSIFVFRKKKDNSEKCIGAFDTFPFTEYPTVELAFNRLQKSLETEKEGGTR